MIVLMNYAVPLLFFIGLGLGYKLKRLWPLVVAGALILVYTVAQPTMLPKGTVAAPVIQATEYVDKPIVDRSLKPMSDADRDTARNKALNEINDSINSKINQ